MPPLKNNKNMKKSILNRESISDNGACGLLLFFLKSTEFAAYGEGLPTAYSLQCVVLCGSVGHIGGFTPGFTTHSDWTATLPSRVEIKTLYVVVLNCLIIKIFRKNILLSCRNCQINCQFNTEQIQSKNINKMFLLSS